MYSMITVSITFPFFFFYSILLQVQQFVCSYSSPLCVKLSHSPWLFSYRNHIRLLFILFPASAVSFQKLGVQNAVAAA